MAIEIKRILVPVDFSDNSLIAKHFAESLAERFQAEIRLLHVVESSPYEVYVQKGFMADVPLYVPVGAETGDPDEEFKKLLDAARKQLEGLVEHTGAYSVNVRNGRPVDQIMEEIEAYKPDLVVMCTHGWTGLKHMVLGSVTEKLVRISPVPVLTTRGSGD